MTLLLLIAGLVTLLVGAELLVRGASRLALALSISPLVVGLTVVALGTSSPELAVTVQGAMSGRVDIALGNIIGSNIFNVLVVLGASAAVVPLVVTPQVIRQEVPIMIAASVVLFLVARNGGVDRTEGLLLVSLLVLYVIFLVVQGRKETFGSSTAAVADTRRSGDRWMHGIAAHLMSIAVGLALLVIGSRWLVAAAVSLADALGISELVIGLTIVAAGTSLPEVATSLVAAVRGERDMAVGNAVGSSTFNILGVLGLTAALAPESLTVRPALLAFDVPVMIAVAVACLPIFFTGSAIARWEGAVFLGYYAAYTAYLVLEAQEHDALETYTLAMQAVVIPLTLITIAVVVTREWRRRTGKA